VNVQYNWRIWPEIGWAVLTAVMIVLAEAALAFDESVFAGDPVAWVTALVGAGVRAIGGAVLAVLTRGGFQVPGEPGPDGNG
jgi:hypothetical protein